MANWPSTAVPGLVQSNNWKEEAPQLFLIQETDGGPPKRRPHPNPAPGRVTCYQILTTTQTVDIDNFYETTLLEGTLPFTETDPRTGSTGQEWQFEAPPMIESLSGGVLWKVNYAFLKLL